MSIRTLALLVPLAVTPAPLAAAPLVQHPAASGGIQWREVAPSRPWLGVSLAGQGDLEVTEVQADSPAAAAGLKPGDRILSLDQRELEDFAALTEALAGHQAGDQVQLGIGRPVSLEFSDEHRAEDGRPLLGVYLDGNRVTEVQEEHPAAGAGLLEGDRILEVDGTRTPSSEAIIEQLRATGDDSVDLLVGRRLPVELGSRPQELAAPLGTPMPFPGPQGFAWRTVPDAAPSPEAGGLRQELRSLVAEITQLREEIAQLRAQIDALQAR